MKKLRQDSKKDYEAAKEVVDRMTLFECAHEDGSWVSLKFNFREGDSIATTDVFLELLGSSIDNKISEIIRYEDAYKMSISLDLKHKMEDRVSVGYYSSELSIPSMDELSKVWKRLSKKILSRIPHCKRIGS